MDTVANQFSGDRFVLRCRTDHAGLAVVDRRHRVIEVSQVGHAGVNRRLGVLVVGIGMGNGDGAELFRLRHKLRRAVQLRSQIHDGDQSFAVVIQLSESVIVRKAQVFAVLRTFFLLREERALHLYAQQTGAALDRVLFQLQPGSQRLGDYIVGQSHRGRGKARHADTRQIVRHFHVALIAAVGKIGVGIAMVVHVDQAGDHISAIQVNRVFFFNQNVTEFPVHNGKTAGNELETLGKDITVLKIHWNLRILGTIDQSLRAMTRPQRPVRHGGSFHPAA